MPRRPISLLVLAAYAVAQWAAVPHAHGCATTGQHGATPHFHLGVKAEAETSRHDHSDEHSHEHRGGDHHEHDSDQAPADTQHGPVECQDTLSGSAVDHDADAVYLPSLTTTLDEMAARDLLNAAAMLASLDQLLGDIQPTDGPGLVDSEPPLRGPGCALYLSLRTLRI